MDCDTTFKQLKHALVHAPILAIPGFYPNFIIETKTSDISVSAVLMQHDQPVAIMSKAFNSAKYHTMDFELLVIVVICKRWYPYLDGKKSCCIDRSKTCNRNIHNT